MKAARYYGIQDVRFETVEKPACGPTDALIQVSYAGICGSDLHIYNKGMFIQNIPETMGHEFVGVIPSGGGPGEGLCPRRRGHRQPHGALYALPQLPGGQL